MFEQTNKKIINGISTLRDCVQKKYWKEKELIILANGII